MESENEKLIFGEALYAIFIADLDNTPIFFYL